MRNYFWLCIILLVVSSCKKKEDVTFHGKVTLCDGSPVANIQIDILRNYGPNSGSEKRDYIGETYTDANGEYLLNMEVSLPGSSGWYWVNLVTTDYLFFNEIQSDNSDKNDDIKTDFIMFRGSTAKCHIKNVSPINDNDVLDSLTYFKNSLERHMPIVYNLVGAPVDTTIIVNITSKKVDLEYTFTKNGISTTRNDTLTPACGDTAYMDIVY